MPISSVDLGPTLLELSGLGIPNHLDGESFFGSAVQARPPVLAGLDTHAHTLLTAMKTPYKLLWDRNRGEVSLFDMRISNPEAEPYDPRPDEKAARAREELLEALAEGLRVRDEEISGGVAGDLSPAIERELRALGHTP
jgi:arylsulfatase A-like enzyme